MNAMNDHSTTSETNPNAKVLRTWTLPPNGVTQRDGTNEEMQLLFQTLPQELSEHLRKLFPPNVLINLTEIYLQIGHIPECTFANEENGGRSERRDILSRPCTKAEIDLFASFFCANSESSGMAATKRKGIPNTLHRVSLITHPMRNPEPVLGVAVRVGRALQGLIGTMTGGAEFLHDLAYKRQSLLLIGKPGVGKTTALREIANILSQNKYLNVVVVDKTCEIAGDGEEPHPAIGKARWMPVGRPGLQADIMREAVENQTPDVIIVDEISTIQEVDAAKTIGQRGVQLIATVHGNTLPELVNCKERGVLLGGCSTVTLSGREAERRYDKRKQVMKRGKEPVFHAAIELHSRDKWVYHPNIRVAVDAYLEGEPCDAQQLEPGRATACASIPGEGSFQYCTECGNGTCAKHSAGHVDMGTGANNADESFNNSSFSNHEMPPVQSSLRSYHDTSSTVARPGAGGFTAGNPSKAQFTFGGRGRTIQKKKGKWRAPRGSGRCHKCGTSGHYARDCKN